MFTRKFIPWVAAATLAATAMGASATLVTTRAGLGGTDFIDWGQLGGDSAEVVLPAAATSNGGLPASLTNAGGGSLFRFDEGGGTYGGNFALGDKLISTLFDAGPISIDFAGPLARVGAQIQSNTFGNFIGIVSVFDAGNVLLETHEFGGVSSDAQDNSAIFLGIVRNAADIDRVEFNIRWLDPQITDLALAINQLDLSTVPGGGGGNVPEPAPVALIALSLLGLLRRARS